MTAGWSHCILITHGYKTGEESNHKGFQEFYPHILWKKTPKSLCLVFSFWMWSEIKRHLELEPSEALTTIHTDKFSSIIFQEHQCLLYFAPSMSYLVLSAPVCDGQRRSTAIWMVLFLFLCQFLFCSCCLGFRLLHTCSSGEYSGPRSWK